MRRIYFLLALFLFAGIAFSQQAEYQSIGTFKSVNVKTNSNTIMTVPQMLPGIRSEEVNKNVSLNSDGPNAFVWTLQFTTPGKVFKDVSFANTQVGYIVTELGWVYKTTNGGINWNAVLGLGFPYYWYGVHALGVDTVVISGFNNQDSTTHGVMKWTTNGGLNWSTDIVLARPTNGVGWLDRVHFYDQNTGIVFNGFSGTCYYTTTGGKTAGAWTFVQVDPALGWFAGNYSFMTNGTVYATGITLSKSTDFGHTWINGPPADNVFDGGVDFLQSNPLLGWTGGGQISSPVSGWTHQTTNGGINWSPRQMVFNYPVRAVKFFNTNTGFAIGGNVYSEGGFIYSTSNGGTNWNLEISTAAEMFSMDYKSVSPDSMDVWVVGSTGGSTGFNGKVYKARMMNLVAVNPISGNIPNSFELHQNYPNPFNPKTNIKFGLPNPSEGGAMQIRLIIYDMLGKEVNELINESLKPGTYNISWDASSFASGIYFYKLTAGEFTSVKKMILVK